MRMRLLAHFLPFLTYSALIQCGDEKANVELLTANNRRNEKKNIVYQFGFFSLHSLEMCHLQLITSSECKLALCLWYCIRCEHISTINNNMLIEATWFE